MRIRAGASTDVGRVREHNEDSYLAQDRLFAVADGMGGHRGGEVASRIAVDALARHGGSDHAGLAGAIREANQAVLARASRDPEKLRGMGTTLTALVAGDGAVHLAHVGDSRAYILRDGELTQLTEDHTLVQRMVTEGSLSPEEAEVHPQRSVLVRALGVEADLEVDEVFREVRAGDRLLLCSDGLTDLIADADIRGLLDVDSRRLAVTGLVRAALDAGGRDNVTCVVADLVDAEPVNGTGLLFGAARDIGNVVDPNAIRPVRSA